MRRLLHLVLVSMLVTGCGLSTQSRDPAVFVQPLEQNPLTLDPARWSDVASGRIMCLVSSPLVRIDENLEIVGDLAASWEVSEENRVFTFKLHPEARFTNGRKVTAADVKYSFERVMDPKTQALRTWVMEPIVGAKEKLEGKSKEIAGVRVVDDATVRIELDRPFAPFLNYMATPVAAVVPREEVERLGDDFSREPVGSGPYRVVKWVNDSYVELVANPRCHLGAPKFAGMRFRVLREPLTRVSEFRLGNLDVIAIPPSEREFFKSHSVWGDRIVERPGLNFYYLGLNCAKKPTSDVRVRRAIAMSIDRNAILKSVRKGQGVQARGPIPPGLGGYDPEFEGIPYDPEQARKLLAEAGFPDGFELELAQGDSKDNLEVTQILASFLEQIGIKVRIAAFEWQTFKSRVNEGLAQSYYLSWWADYADAENFLFPLFHSSQAGPGGNGPRYEEPEVDAMLEEARRVDDRQAREALYGKIQRRVVEDASRVFLFHKLDQIVTQPWVEGVKLYPVFNSNRYLTERIDPAKMQ